MAEQTPNVNILNKEIIIESKKYAIFIVENGNGSYHYILIYHRNNNEYYYHDPLKPSALFLKNGIPMIGDTVDNNNYKYTGAGITLP